MICFVLHVGIAQTSCQHKQGGRSTVGVQLQCSLQCFGCNPSIVIAAQSGAGVAQGDARCAAEPREAPVQAGTNVIALLLSLVETLKNAGMHTVKR